MHDIIIEADNTTTQIDNIVVSIYGIFVNITKLNINKKYKLILQGLFYLLYFITCHKTVVDYVAFYI